MTRHIGLYLHIPFCRSKCAYCDFPSYAGKNSLMGAYVERVLREIDARRGDYVIDTAYIGGGTPSTLPPPMIDRLLRAIAGAYRFSGDAEFTCEVNPGAVTAEFLDTIVKRGVNRLSIGAQAAQTPLLKRLGRIHTWRDVTEAVSAARAAGIDNINLDLMLGLPFQTLTDVAETLERAVALAPTHISCYGLIVEDGTPMQARVQSGAWTLPAEDLERDMYEAAREFLETRGFSQYEISNFAQPGRECRHNVDCWKRREYLGIGAAACGFLGGTRYRNPPVIERYLAFDSPEVTRLSESDARFESVMLGLRMTKGLSEEAFERMHGVAFSDVYGKQAQTPIDQGLLERKNGFLRLTRRGMDVQNAVLLHFL